MSEIGLALRGIDPNQLCRRNNLTPTVATRVSEHFITDRASHIHKHLERNEACSKLCSKHCFQVLNSKFALRLKEAIHDHIKRENPSLNSQVKHINFKFSL